MNPLITIICLCYNHENYVIETLNSINNQSYKNIELIIVDDASTDKSVENINKFLGENSLLLGNQITDKPQFLALTQNIGNCKAFNLALKLAKGKYVIDLATDDILLPQRIENQIVMFEKLPQNYAVVFSNAAYINEKGTILYAHHKPNEIVYSGNIYEKIVAHSYICTPTMMIRKSVLDELGGYDETLSYEDFDFWIRSSRNYYYQYSSEILTQKRILKNSLGTQFYTIKAYPHLFSTLQICHKIANLNHKSGHLANAENAALAKRLRYHLRLCCYTHNFELALKYYGLLSKIAKINILDKIWKFMALYKIPLHKLYALYKSL
jgi:glycosyltransferase involved in cell wall biosynthesis